MYSTLIRTRRKLCVQLLFVTVIGLALAGPLNSARAAMLEEAREWFVNNTANQCRKADEIDALFSSGDIKAVTQHQIPRTDYEGKLQPDKKDTTLFEFFCDSGAYNRHNIYVLYDDGLFTQLSFAQPTIAVVYEDENSDSAVKSVSIIGFESRLTVVNPHFDPKSRTLKETGYWRGVGDASNESWWEFMGDRFVLRQYRVDASYDGEINPEHEFSWPRP